MYEIIVTGVSPEVNYDAEGAPVPYLETIIMRYEFKDWSAMHNAVAGLSTTHGCVKAQRLYVTPE